MESIKILDSDRDIVASYDVMKQLRPHILESEYLSKIRLQEAESKYQLAAYYERDRIACVAGFRISHSLAWGKFLYVDDLVTDEQSRSQGAGKAMFEWLVSHARSNSCHELHLDSGVQRHEAHRFYLRERMDIVFYHFRLKL
jgi:GNAT superfamily N-acetyltransferase